MSEIKGGEPVKTTIALTDADMKEVKALEDSGFGQRDMPSEALGAFVGYQSRYAQRAGKRSKGELYTEWRRNLDDMLYSNDSKAVQLVGRANASMHQKFLTSGQVHTDAVIQQMSLQYGNEEYIGEQIMPPILVDKQSGLYQVYPQRERFAFPSDELDDYSEPNEINETRTTTSYACEGRGYKNSVAATTLANQDSPLNEMLDLTESIMEGMYFQRERRIAAVAGIAGSYGANTAAIAAANRWDSATGGDPIANMQTADAALWQGRGQSDKVMFSSLDVAHVLMRHPDILGLFQYNGSSPGLATPDMIARFLGADRYLVGAARRDSANENQTAVYARIWPDVFGLVRVPRNPTLRNAFFGATFRWRMQGVPGLDAAMGYVTQQWFDEKVGLGGAYWAKATCSETHDVIAPLTGYLYTTPIN